jgi:hypothetical protein
MHPMAQFSAPSGSSHFLDDDEDDDLALSLSFLPNELLTAIFIHCRPHDLAILSRISVRFNALAERLLYSSIYIKDMLSPASPSPWRTMRCCKSLLSMSERRESLARAGKGRGKGTEVFCVRWLNGVTSDAQPPPPPLRTPPSHNYHRQQHQHHRQVLIEACLKLSQALRTLQFLTRLEIFLGPANNILSSSFVPTPMPMHAIERVLLTPSHTHALTFPHLLTLSLGAESSKTSQPYTSILTQFLSSPQSVPALQQLCLLDHHSPLDLPPNALRHLTAFRGSVRTATCIVPGRPVRKLSLLGPDSDLQINDLSNPYPTSYPNSSVNSNRLQILHRLTQTTTPVRVLDLSAMSVRLGILKGVAGIGALGRDVEVLRVRLTLRHTLHYALSGIVSVFLPSGLFVCVSVFFYYLSFSLLPSFFASSIFLPIREVHLPLPWGGAKFLLGIGFVLLSRLTCCSIFRFSRLYFPILKASFARTLHHALFSSKFLPNVAPVPPCQERFFYVLELLSIHIYF